MEAGEHVHVGAWDEARFLTLPTLDQLTKLHKLVACAQVLHRCCASSKPMLVLLDPTMKDVIEAEVVCAFVVYQPCLCGVPALVSVRVVHRLAEATFAMVHAHVESLVPVLLMAIT